MDDAAIVEAQIGRPPRSPVEVVARCPLGLPAVTAVPPFLDDGTPFPTRYWLTCPLAVKRLGRVEAEGGVHAAETMIAEEASFAEAYAAAMTRYEAERDALVPADHTGPRPVGGVGGSQGGVKCLHAHYADHAAGNKNPVGEWVAHQVEPLNCTVPCVAGGERNPAWVEPPLP